MVLQSSLKSASCDCRKCFIYFKLFGQTVTDYFTELYYVIGNLDTEFTYLKAWSLMGSLIATFLEGVVCRAEVSCQQGQTSPKRSRQADTKRQRSNLTKPAGRRGTDDWSTAAQGYTEQSCRWWSGDWWGLAEDWTGREWQGLKRQDMFELEGVDDGKKTTLKNTVFQSHVMQWGQWPCNKCYLCWQCQRC